MPILQSSYDHLTIILPPSFDQLTIIYEYLTIMYEYRARIIQSYHNYLIIISHLTVLKSSYNRLKTILKYWDVLNYKKPTKCPDLTYVKNDTQHNLHSVHNITTSTLDDGCHYAE